MKNVSPLLASGLKPIKDDFCDVCGGVKSMSAFGYALVRFLSEALSFSQDAVFLANVKLCFSFYSDPVTVLVLLCSDYSA